MPTPQEVLRFRFEETPPSAWFRAGPERDRIVGERFGSLTDQALAGGLDPWGERAAAFARRHLDVITHFGRFPHRNQALGRPSSPEEEAFLQQPGSRF